MQLQLKNEEASFNALLSSATEIAEKCNMIIVTDEVTLAIANQQLSGANSLLKQIEDIRKKLKEPYFQAGKQIDALAKKLSEPMEAAINNGKNKIITYNREIQRKQAEEQVKIQAIKYEMTQFAKEAMLAMDNANTMDELRAVRDKWVVQSKDRYPEFKSEFEAIRTTLNDYAKSRRIAIETPQQSIPEETEVIAEFVQQKVEEMPEVTIQADVKGLKRKWTYEIVDESKVPRALLMVDDKAIKNFIKENEDKMAEGIVFGIRFFQEEKLTIR